MARWAWLVFLLGCGDPSAQRADAGAIVDASTIAVDSPPPTFACGLSMCGAGAVCVLRPEGPSCGAPTDAGQCQPGCLRCDHDCQPDWHACWSAQRYATCEEVLAAHILTSLECSPLEPPTCVAVPEGGFILSCGPDRPGCFP